MTEFRLTPSSDEEFRDRLRKRAREELFFPRTPIRDFQFLRGRERPFKQTIEALQVPGTSAFIFGERGVGKSSLALVAANYYNTSESEPIRVTCDPRVGFGKLLAKIVGLLLDERSPSGKRKKTITELQLKAGPLQLAHRIEAEPEKVPDHVDASDAVQLLDALIDPDPKVRRVAIVDEVDLIQDPTFREDLAIFIKQLGDNSARIKFIFAGIAKNISDLLLHHESAGRCLATIHLDRLPANVLKDIIVDGFKPLDIGVQETTAYRIADISDGFAYFTHLIGQKLALVALEQQVIPPSVDNGALIEEAVRNAIGDMELSVKEAYDAAARKYENYEHVLWAVSDHWELYRSLREIRESYDRICRDVNALREKAGSPPLEPVDHVKFRQMLYRLKSAAYGTALVSNRRSQYRFRLSMLRGYCRLVAASHGISVGLNYRQSGTPLLPPQTPTFADDLDDVPAFASTEEADAAADAADDESD